MRLARVRAQARCAAVRSLAAAAPILLATGPALAADPAKGANLYTTHCVACHGQGGKPVWPGAPDFRRPGTLMKTDAQLLALLKQGRGVMPSYLGVMKDRDMYDLVAYLRTLS